MTVTQGRRARVRRSPAGRMLVRRLGRRLGRRPDRRTRAAAPVSCVTCTAPYRPGLTGWACPVCDTAAPGAGSRRRRRLDDADDRLLALVLLATIANVVLLGVLTVIVGRT